MPDLPKVSEKYLTDYELAALLRITIERLRNKISAGEPLPPYIRLPRCRKRLWNAEQVHHWLDEFTVGGTAALSDHAAKMLRASITQRIRVNRRRSKSLLRL